MITANEIKALFENRTEAEKEIIKMYLRETEENRGIISKVVKLLAEDPSRLDFAKNWNGSAEELRLSLAQI